MSLNSTIRATHLDSASKTTYDLVIVGGGITGAGIALDAASRGLKVLLLEKNDFAFGTSSRSTKLIHGGLRYLKQLRFKEVSEVGRERQILFKNAPHIVFPEKMLLPIYKNGTFGKISTSIGLMIYDFLAGVNSKEKRKMLDSHETIITEPLLRTKGLIGSGLYYEYRTEDYRLVIDLIKKATTYGALCLNYCSVRKFIIEQDKIKGVIAKDVLSEREIKIEARVVVNASGPWTDTLTRLDNRNQKKILIHTKGVHLVFNKKDFPIKQSVYFDTEDGRMIFAIPKGETTYAGTTDTIFKEDINNPTVSDSDANYILRALAYAFPGLGLSKKNVISCWAGIRPLIQDGDKSPSEISRKDEIIISKHGLISIAGGKLTGYRIMAEKICDIVIKNKTFTTNKKILKCHTHNISLVPELNSSSKDISYYVEHEATQTLCDFFIRRTGMLYFEPHKVEQLIEQSANEMQKLLHWTQEIRSTNILNLLSELKAVTHFNSSINENQD